MAAVRTMAITPQAMVAAALAVVIRRSLPLGQAPPIVVAVAAAGMTLAMLVLTAALAWSFFVIPSITASLSVLV